MSEKKWTTISVTESQKEILEEHKPDGMSMGKFLVSLFDEDSEFMPPAMKINDTGNKGGEDVSELAEEISQLRRDIDEFKHNVPERVAAQFR